MMDMHMVCVLSLLNAIAKPTMPEPENLKHRNTTPQQLYVATPQYYTTTALCRVDVLAKSLRGICAAILPPPRQT